MKCPSIRVHLKFLTKNKSYLGVWSKTHNNGKKYLRPALQYVFLFCFDFGHQATRQLLSLSKVMVGGRGDSYGDTLYIVENELCSFSMV